MMYPCRALVLTCLAALALAVSSARVRSEDAYTLLAKAIEPGINQPGEDVESISKALSTLSSAQSALKKIE